MYQKVQLQVEEEDEMDFSLGSDSFRFSPGTVPVVKALVMSVFAAADYVTVSFVSSFASPTLTAISLTWQPVFVGVGGYFFLHETLSLLDLLGGCIILVALGVSISEPNLGPDGSNTLDADKSLHRIRYTELGTLGDDGSCMEAGRLIDDKTEDEVGVDSNEKEMQESAVSPENRKEGES